MKTLISALLLVAASSAFAAPTAEPVRTGVPLDVAKTISITDISKACGVVQVEWLYDDSQGVRHLATYSVLGEGCSGD